MIEQITLTPAQIEFIKHALPEFDGALHGELAGRAASQRYFTRIKHQDTPYILVAWDSSDEDWERFLSIGRDRKATSGLLPIIYADDPKHGLILEEDLGSMTLRKFSETSSTHEATIEGVYRKTLEALALWQSPHVACQPVVAARRMDSTVFLWETAYFARFCVTDYCGCEHLLSSTWEAERFRLANECAALPTTAIHRDFQSENVMLKNAVVRFVDYQGARLGPPEYDVASLLFDPYCNELTDSMRNKLFEYYVAIQTCGTTSHRAFNICAVQRLMQALGAYGNLALHKGKPWYEVYIVPALTRLVAILDQLDDYPTLTKVVTSCTAACAMSGKIRKATSGTPT